MDLTSCILCHTGERNAEILRCAQEWNQNETLNSGLHYDPILDSDQTGGGWGGACWFK